MGHRQLRRASSGRPRPGIWAVGHRTGPAGKSVADPLGQQSYWNEDTRATLPDVYVPVHLPFLAAPLGRDAIGDVDGLGELEILRQAQGSNQSFLTGKQWDVLQHQLPVLADSDATLQQDDAVEVAAVQAVKAALEGDHRQGRDGGEPLPRFTTMQEF